MRAVEVHLARRLAVIFLVITVGIPTIVLITLGASAMGVTGEALSAIILAAALVYGGAHFWVRERMRGPGPNPLYQCGKCGRRIRGRGARAI